MLVVCCARAFVYDAVIPLASSGLINQVRLLTEVKTMHYSASRTWLPAAGGTVSFSVSAKMVLLTSKELLSSKMGLSLPSVVGRRTTVY